MGLLWLFAHQVPVLAGQDVQLVPLALSSHYGEGMVPWAITFSCADDEQTLRDFFKGQGVLFSSDLIRTQAGRRCHVYHQPSVPGFRASPDDSPIRELFFNYDTLRFLSMRTEPLGDTLDVVKAVLQGVERPLTIRLGVHRALDTVRSERALAHYFGEDSGQVFLEETGPHSSNPWAQDFLKGGSLGRAPMALIPHRLYEGENQNGSRFMELLDSLSQRENFARSRLSWEGGDLQFMNSPRNSRELILFYGDSAKAYWGDTLTSDEFGYVLKREFGADVVADLSGLAAHIDYFVSFIPKAGVALVSDPVSGNMELAMDAFRLLSDSFRGLEPPELDALGEALLVSGPGRSPIVPSRVLGALERAKRAHPDWYRQPDLQLRNRLHTYVRATCPEDQRACFSLQGQRRMLRTDGPLLRDWVAAAVKLRSENKLIAGLLAVIESQFRHTPEALRERTEAAILKLRELGFRIIRVPRIAGTAQLKVPWAGINYVNGLLVDTHLFLPRFGLGPSEDLIFARLQRQLAPDYTVVPVLARDLLLHNGGIHCVAGIIR